ncbi:hypothetical protein WJ0W_002626 [Paenibacillus melissococcoides]|uniref:Uncharacterized protein n=2 Tax=Paenibacillus TaxID=44249 RepID=A0ABM9G2G3_9BACL|nr:hypothetical protein WJ0W_002626 [Paenibacillus melissococcoides]
MRPGRGRQKTGEELACLLLLVEGGGKPRWQEQAHGCALRHGGPTLARENQAGRGGAWAAAVPLACGRPGPGDVPKARGALWPPAGFGPAEAPAARLAPRSRRRRKWHRGALIYKILHTSSNFRCVHGFVA